MTIVTRLLDCPLDLPNCQIDQMQVVAATLRIDAHTTSTSARCPRCQHASDRVHSRSVRTIRDVPSGDYPVLVMLQVRLFFCPCSACPQRTFAERLPDLVATRARRTLRYTRRLQAIGSAVGAEAGVRLAHRLQFRTSPTTLLRIMRSTPVPTPTVPRVLGVDDFALRKGKTYGTLLVDLEHHCPMAMLSDRTAATLATWLREHPGVAIIARDRSTEYARGATLGAPTAQQVADRWHLLKNQREALERMLTRCYASLATLPPVQSTLSVMTPRRTQALRRPSATEQAASHHARVQRATRYRQVQTLVHQGLSHLQIAQQLHMSRTTVIKYATAAAFPERRYQRVQPSMLDRFLPYLQQRWQAGYTNASQLWRELCAQGYSGVQRQVARWAAQQRTEPARTTPACRRTQSAHAEPEHREAPARQTLAAPRTLAWLLIQPTSSLSAVEAATVRRLQQDSTVVHAQQLAERFQAMVRERVAADFDVWLADCATSSIPELAQFAKSLSQEYASIRAALTEVWSSGQVEGQVTRLKYLKRQIENITIYCILSFQMKGWLPDAPVCYGTHHNEPHPGVDEPDGCAICPIGWPI